MEESKKKILVVEDEVSQLHALRDKLAREGFLIVEAINGKQGLKRALQERPDLILLDILLPKMDGMTMLKNLRKQNNWGKHVPVIILTNLTSDDEDRMHDITETEPSAYLVKADWKIDEVITKVRERLAE